MHSAKVLGIQITTDPKLDIIKEVEKALSEHRQLVITTPNPEIIVEAHHNQDFKVALNAADISLPDGTGIVWALKRQGIVISRILGRDFFINLLELSEKHRWKVALVGASPESNHQSAERIRKNYGEIEVLEIVDIFLDKQGNMTSENKKTQEEIIDELKTFKPQILTLAFGHPKQELWANKIRANFPESVVITVGGTLDYFSGQVPMPPQIFSSLGMEWLFRLIVQPWRLRRIITAVVEFPWLVLRHSL